MHGTWEPVAPLLDQIELQFEELESSATEDEIAAEMAVAKTTTVAAFTGKRPARKPFPEHLPRERVIVPGPTTCLCCGGSRLRKLGETVTETLESIPRQWKVIQHVREKFTCRDCEKISQAPAPADADDPDATAISSRSCSVVHRVVAPLAQRMFPSERMRDNGRKIVKARPPVQRGTCALRIGHDLRRITLAPRRNLDFEIDARHALDRFDHLQHRKAMIVAAIEGQRRAAGTQMTERIGMRAREIAHVNIVANARAVGRRIIVAEDVELRAQAERGFQPAMMTR